MTEKLKKRGVTVVVALLTIYIVWGSTYLAIRIGLDGWPPFLLAGSRFVTAGLVLLLVGYWRGEPLPQSWPQLRTVVISGLLMLTIGNAGVVWAELYVASGMTAVIVATVSLWMMALEALRPGGERMTWAKFGGAIVGLVGVAVLMAPHLSNGQNGKAFLGQIVLLGSSLSWAIGSIYSRHAPIPKSNIMGSGVQMLAAGIALFIMAGSTGEFAQFDSTRALGAPLLALLYLITLGSCVAFTAYTWLLRHTSPALASTYAYVNPLVAVMLGALVLNEPVTRWLIAGTVLVISSVFVIQQARMRLVAQSRIVSSALPMPEVIKTATEAAQK